MCNNSKKDAFLTVRVPKDLLEEMKLVAKQDRRAISNWARVVLEQAVKERRPPFS